MTAGSAKPPGHRVVKDGTPKPGSGLASMGHKGPHGKPADSPPKSSPYTGKKQLIE